MKCTICETGCEIAEGKSGRCRMYLPDGILEVHAGFWDSCILKIKYIGNDFHLTWRRSRGNFTANSTA